MKKLALGLLLTSLTGAAYAADLPAPPAAPYTKAPAIVSPITNWNGFYIGGMGGYGSENSDQFAIKGGFAGGTVGYNWQFGPIWVVGVEGDAAWADDSQTQFGLPGCAVNCVRGAVVTPSALPSGGDSASVKMLWDASARGRLGYLVTPDLLIYATGGVAWQNIEASGQCGPYFVSAQYGGP